MKKFNFLNLQTAFLAFQNRTRENAFEHYDVLNKQRVNNIKHLMIKQYTNLDECKTKMSEVKKTIQSNEHTLTEFTEMWEQL